MSVPAPREGSDRAPRPKRMVRRAWVVRAEVAMLLAALLMLSWMLYLLLGVICCGQ